jgi:hypothetical protein
VGKQQAKQVLEIDYKSTNDRKMNNRHSTNSNIFSNHTTTGSIHALPDVVNNTQLFPVTAPSMALSVSTITPRRGKLDDDDNSETTGSRKRNRECVLACASASVMAPLDATTTDEVMHETGPSPGWMICLSRV